MTNPSELGKLIPPYGGITNCANEECQRELNEELGAFMFRWLVTNKLCVLCGSCALYAENDSNFMLVAL
jgi:hypothetical protein